MRSDVLLAALDMAGVEASAGSACASGAPLPSHVLRAMGYPDDLAAGALRCTTGRSTTIEDVDRAAELIARAVAQSARAPGVAPRHPPRLIAAAQAGAGSPISVRSAAASVAAVASSGIDLRLQRRDHGDARRGGRLLEQRFDRGVVAEQVAGVGRRRSR